MTQHIAPTKVVVIGGGYSGTLAANHLRMRGDIDITLVNPRPKFVERIRLHQLVAGTHEATADYGSLLGDGIKLVVDHATKIDTAARIVQFASGRQALPYDYVIYAVGSTGAVPKSVPGAVEFAYPIAELEQAQRLHTAIDDLHPDAPITVVGAGLTGIEAATELAEQGATSPWSAAASWGRTSPTPGVGRSQRCCANWASRCSRPTSSPRCGRTRWSSPTAPCVRVP
jgi:NADH dehydrogenase